MVSRIQVPPVRGFLQQQPPRCHLGTNLWLLSFQWQLFVNAWSRTPKSRQRWKRFSLSLSFLRTKSYSSLCYTYILPFCLSFSLSFSLYLSLPLLANWWAANGACRTQKKGTGRTGKRLSQSVVSCLGWKSASISQTLCGTIKGAAKRQNDRHLQKSSTSKTDTQINRERGRH